MAELFAVLRAAVGLLASANKTRIWHAAPMQSSDPSEPLMGNGHKSRMLRQLTGVTLPVVRVEALKVRVLQGSICAGLLFGLFIWTRETWTAWPGMLLILALVGLELLSFRRLGGRAGSGTSSAEAKVEVRADSALLLDAVASALDAIDRAVRDVGAPGDDRSSDAADRAPIVSAIPQLKQHLGRCLVAGLLEDVVQESLRAWRDGEITTLAELEPHMRRLAESWIESDAARVRIAEHCAKWFEPVQRQLNARTDQICQSNRVPVGALLLDVSLDTMATIDVSKMPLDSTNPTASIVNVGAAIAALMVASLLGGGGWALLMAGPIGWCIGLVVGVVAAYYGKSQTESYLKEMDIPVTIRKVILRESKIAEQVRQTKPKLRTEIERQLEKLEEPFEALIAGMKEQLRTCLQTKADETRLLIQ